MENIRNRNLGEIYTPKCVANLLKEQVESVIPNFEDKCLIWDCCWGEGNLTAPLNASDLWCSTLREQDILDNKDKAGNKFVYDFLNYDIEPLKSVVASWSWKYKSLPEHILKVLNLGKSGIGLGDFEDSDEDFDFEFEEEDTYDKKFTGENLGTDTDSDKPIIIYMNPPYVGVGVFGANNTDFREESNLTGIREIMNERKLGTSSSQAYVQFMYRVILMKRCYPNKRIYVALVSPTTYLCTNGFKEFREEWLKEFKLMSGACMCADTFKGLSNRWGIATTVWGPVEELGVNNEYELHNFKTSLYGLGENLGDKEFTQYGEKILYNIDGLRPANELAKESVLRSHLIEAPVTCSSGCKVSNKKSVSWADGSIGFMFFKGNNVYHNVTEIGLMSVPYGDGSGCSITEDNVLDILALFASKGSVGVYDRTWTNDKDEYTYPNKHCKEWEILKINSIVYGLFNDSTHFARLSNVKDMNGNVTEVINHFHYLSGVETSSLFMKGCGELGEKELGQVESRKEGLGNGELPDRLGYKLLEYAKSTGLLLDSAYKVLERANELFMLTLNEREAFDKEHPEYQVTQPEAGYYQWKWILKENHAEEYKDWRLGYREFSRDIKELVYKVGMLKNRAVDLNGVYIE